MSDSGSSSSSGSSTSSSKRRTRLRKHKSSSPAAGGEAAAAADTKQTARGSSKRGKSPDGERRAPLQNVVARNPREEARERGKTKSNIDLSTTRAGGTYIPPARLRMMQQQIQDKSSVAYQRMVWDALKKSINGIINKVNVGNIKMMVPELFHENLIRGRGLLCRSIMKAQHSSQGFTHVYAALVSVVNTKFPKVGELLLSRLILLFRRSFRRNDKHHCLSVCKFLAQLVNQQVAHEIVALEILTLLLGNATDDSVEVAIAFLKECGQFLADVSPRGLRATFERLRTVLHEGSIDKRTQYMIEVMFAVQKDGFKDFPIVAEGLDLVEDEDQITHMLSLDGEMEAHDMLDVFREDKDFVANEEKYKEIRSEILGDDSSDEDGDDEDSGSGSDSDDDEDQAAQQAQATGGQMEISDMTGTNLVALRRTIYLSLMSSAGFEEAAHKLLKMTIQPGQEMELANMLIECCTQERTYMKFFGLLSQRFCAVNRDFQEAFCQAFVEQYATVHRLETNKLRQMAKMFAHLMITDAIPWSVLQVIRLNETETTSSSRIFIKELMLQISEFLGVPAMVERFADPTMKQHYAHLFPKDNPKSTRFSINFFTSIGLGGLTDEMREHLRTAPKTIMAQRQQGMVSDDSESDSDSSGSSSSSSSGSDSDSSSGSDSDSSSSSGSSSGSGSPSPPPPPSRRQVDAKGPPSEERRRGGRDRTPPRAQAGDRNRERSPADGGKRSKSEERDEAERQRKRDQELQEIEARRSGRRPINLRNEGHRDGRDSGRDDGRDGRRDGGRDGRRDGGRDGRRGGGGRGGEREGHRDGASSEGHRDGGSDIKRRGSPPSGSRGSNGQSRRRRTRSPISERHASGSKRRRD